ncbi:MAG: hypothetical protein WBN20_11660 [Eudoraea sp.]|uniref:hypothetical protein n=1 Tax=Eudoraea sp. TaxID=1979955 RepID=UPI003C73A5B5
MKSEELLNGDTIIAISIFAVTIILVLFLRKKVGKDYEIKTSDIIIAIVPLAVWLLLTGKVERLKVGDFEVTLVAEAIQEAKNTEISETAALISPISSITKEIDNIRGAPKSSLVDLDKILKSKPEALIFLMGYDNYGSTEIEQYLNKLAQSTLKYIIINDYTTGKFKGIISLELLMPQIFSKNPEFTADDLKIWLENSNETEIYNIDGLLSFNDAIKPTTSKYVALENMQKLETTFLPVINEKEEFIGVIHMEQLSTSLLMDISKNLIATAPAKK